MKKYLYIFIIGLLIVIGSIIGYFSYKDYHKTNVPEVDKFIKEKKKSNYEETKKEEIPYTNELPKYREQYGNNDIMGRLEIPNLNINSLVTKTDNNTFYLTHNYVKEQDNLGVPFFDSRNNNLLEDKQINIYGHNTENEQYRSRLPFINLTAYLDKNIFEKYKNLYLSIDEKKVTYEVIAIKIIEKDDNVHMRLSFNDNEDFVNHTKTLIEGSVYQREKINIKKADRIIVLQVCNYNPRDTYLLVIGKEV